MENLIMWGRLGAGAPPGLQIPCGAVSAALGGFDSHAPPRMGTYSEIGKCHQITAVLPLISTFSTNALMSRRCASGAKCPMFRTCNHTRCRLSRRVLGKDFTLSLRKNPHSFISVHLSKPVPTCVQADCRWVAELVISNFEIGIT